MPRSNTINCSLNRLSTRYSCSVCITWSPCRCFHESTTDTFLHETDQSHVKFNSFGRYSFPNVDGLPVRPMVESPSEVALVSRSSFFFEGVLDETPSSTMGRTNYRQHFFNIIIRNDNDGTSTTRCNAHSTER